MFAMFHSGLAPLKTRFLALGVPVLANLLGNLGWRHQERGFALHRPRASQAEMAPNAKILACLQRRSPVVSRAQRYSALSKDTHPGYMSIFDSLRRILFHGCAAESRLSRRTPGPRQAPNWVWWPPSSQGQTPQKWLPRSVLFGPLISYQYDSRGLRTKLTYPDNSHISYEYDTEGKLRRTRSDGNDMSFHYDALGNRRRTINSGAVDDQTNSLNKYTSVGGTACPYDDNGNLAFDGQFRYCYDCENRLLDVNDTADARVASCAYDYLGRRISRRIYGSPNVTLRYACDGDRVLAECHSSGTLLREFVYGLGLDEPICSMDAGNGNAGYYYHLDGLGSVVALSDVNNVLVERYAYDVFGRPTIRDPDGLVLAASLGQSVPVHQLGL